MTEIRSKKLFLRKGDLKNKSATNLNVGGKVKIKINNHNIIDNLARRRHYANDNFNCKKEIALWKGVILQSLVDLKSRSKKKMAKVNRIKSILWLNLSNKDFHTACSYADLDPLYVWEKSQIIKNNNPLI